MDTAAAQCKEQTPTSIMHPPCVVCGRPVDRRPRETGKAGENLTHWLRRKACCPEHSRLAQAANQAATKKGIRSQLTAAHEHEPCPVCKGVVDINPNEKPGAWRKRITCSERCRSLRTRSSPAKARQPRPVKANTPPPHKTPRRHLPGSRFESVEEALARGLVIQRTEKPVYLLPTEASVRGGRWMGDGRV
jgi:hypothetical protein